MPDIAPLSLEGAIGLLIEKAAPEEKATPSAEAETPQAKAAEETKQPEAVEGAEASPAEGEKDTPADQGETNDEGGDQGDALPPIEPPSSWKAEEKTVWESLPRAAQEAIQRREQDRTTELRNLQNSTAEQRKAADAEVIRLKGLADAIEKQVQGDATELAKLFPEIRSESDLVALAQRDPARFSVFQAHLAQFQMRAQSAKQAQEELGKKAETEQRDYLNKAKEKLLEAFPAWKDPQVARKEITELQEYAISQGASEQTARQALDPIVYKFAQKAMAWDKAQAEKAKALVRTPPRVVKPGTSSTNSKAEDKAERRRNQLSKLDKSGDLEDARGLLRA